MAVLAATAVFAIGCGKVAIDAAPPTIAPAGPAQSPPVTDTPTGRVLPLPGTPTSAIIDPTTGSLMVLTADHDATTPTAALTVFDGDRAPRTIALPGAPAALATDGTGRAYAAGRGGYINIDIAAGTAHHTAIEGQQDTDFTAIARRADGQMVLGTANGAILTIAGDNTVANQTHPFARVDAIVAQGDSAVALDRAQTSVTELDHDGSPGLALRAGLGATTMVADPMGRVLVTDTRGGQLLVFGVDPLMERQAYPVGGAPYGVTGSKTLVWVSLTATNTVVGYDLATGIPVERVRYPTVQQPNALAFDDRTDTLYVVSGNGGGVQVIDNAGTR